MTNERCEIPEHGWTCFHCNETFTDPRMAADHFGFEQSSDPACRIKAGAERWLLTSLRQAEKAAADAQWAVQNECTDSANAYYAQLSRHNQQLRHIEEEAYERGLSDGKQLAPETVGEAAQ